MKTDNVRFLKSAAKLADFPRFSYPEFAFFGRSNVGKSSLINMLTSRRSLVKTGARPGVTRLINFFLIDEKISLADMPGFGFADLPKSVSSKFMPLIRDYINNRENLKMSFLLVDIRRIPDETEKEVVMELTENNKSVAIIATKCDKMTRNQKIVNAKKIAEVFTIETGSVFFTSAKTGEGKKEIYKIIDEFSKAKPEQRNSG